MSSDTVATVTKEPHGGAAVDRLIRERGLRKWWVAKEIGTHPSHLSKLITGERPITKSMAARLGVLFGVDPAVFRPGGADETPGESNGR